MYFGYICLCSLFGLDKQRKSIVFSLQADEKNYKRQTINYKLNYGNCYGNKNKLVERGEKSLQRGVWKADDVVLPDE
jgi:hypothetical protein